jgi:hypothetical protein
MTFPLSKSKLQSHHQCPKKLWLEINQPNLAPINEVQQLILDRGTAFGNAIRSTFSDGVLIEEKNSQKALIETAKWFNLFASGEPRKPVFEAAFTYKGIIVRVDVLNPLPGGTWELIEVKSGSLKPSHVRDASIQALVIEMSGAFVNLSKISIGIPESTFTFTGSANIAGILNVIDKTLEAKELFTEIESCIESALNTVVLPTVPEVSTGAHCKTPHACGFATHCTIAKLQPGETFIVPVWHLSKDPLTKIVQKFLPKKRDLAAVSKSDLETAIQLQMREVACGKPYYLESALQVFLNEQPFPRYFLDYETNNSPLPLWVGTHPGEVIPFQFSLHVWTAPDAPLQHHEFIATTNVDPRPALAKALVDAISLVGPVFAWNGNSTEGPITEKLCTHYPSAAATLRQIADSCRENDPLRKFRQWMYFPKMAGDWGLKSIAKSILPINPYADLKIKNGVDAMKGYEQYLSMHPSPERNQLEGDLKEYCGVDTAVMVDIWKKIQALPASI